MKCSSIATRCLPPAPESWTPLAEVQAKNLLSPARLRSLLPLLNQAKSQVASERELADVPPELRPLDAGFIMLPQTFLDGHRRKGAESDLGRILARAQQLRDEVDRVVVLGVGGSYSGARGLFERCAAPFTTNCRPKPAWALPRLYFEGTNFDTDALQDLLDLFESTCVDPDVRDERWARSSSASRGRRWKQRRHSASSAAKFPSFTARKTAKRCGDFSSP